MPRPCFLRPILSQLATRLRESDDFPNARVVGWEGRDGTYHPVYDSEGEKVGRAPTDRSLENAERTVIEYDGEFFTVGALTPDYNIDEALSELEDFYAQVSG